MKMEWVDVYDLDVKTGRWSAVEGKPYYSAEATLAGDAWHQEAVGLTLHPIIWR